MRHGSILLHSGMLMKMKMLVTGGSGRMGQMLLPTLQGVLFAPRSSDLEIRDELAVHTAFEQFKPDVVLHMAAYTDVGKAELERELCWAVNVQGTRNLARACTHSGARLVHISTDYVFDGELGMYKETDTPNPSNFYSLTKTVAEEAARAAFGSLIVRTSFKDAVWKYPMAFSDQYTSADYTDVIAAELLTLLTHLEQISTDVLHIVTERKSILELAQRRNPNVQAGSRLGAKVHIPPDVSLDNSRWQELKSSFARGNT
jgi:dTDP-4-dehydrorhamnose reductase